MGPKVEELEELVAAACGVEHAVAVSNGTAALHLAVLALGLGEGDEVIVPAYTFPATANVVRLAGAKPVLVDVDPATFNLDVAKAYEAVTPRTKAVLAVHLFGRPLDWEELQSAVPPDVTLLEDAAGALGAKWRGMPCGGLGAAGCLSFHPRKIVTTGEGGAVTTNDAELAASVRRLRHHGLDPGADIKAPSTNYRLADILCAVGIPQLRRLDELHAERARIADGYTERLRDLVDVPEADEGDTHGWQAYVIRLDRKSDALETLRAEGIEVQIGTYALQRLSAYRDQGPFPGADAAFDRALALPLHSRLSDADLDRVAAGIARFA
jgi:dTDP-4-amino-4,6-dideoxygalactose transaminase